MVGGAAALTASVVAPSTAEVSPEARRTVRDRLAHTVPSLVDGLPPGDQVVVTIGLLRQLGRGAPGPLGQDEPFAWKPTFVRRSLGLAAVQACLDHRFRTPLEAVGPVADQAVAEWRRSGWRTFHWEPWLAGLADGARSAVLAEAATWATTLWSSFDWGAFPEVPRLGGPDDQWVCASSPTVRLKARSELQIALPAGARHPAPLAGPALVSIAGGVPRRHWEAELGYLALVAAVRSPSRPAPARVVGIWPDAGEHRVVEITEPLLTEAADLVVDAITAVVDSTVSSQV
jgi:hypothetical protein